TRKLAEGVEEHLLVEAEHRRRVGLRGQLDRVARVADLPLHGEVDVVAARVDGPADEVAELAVLADDEEVAQVEPVDARADAVARVVRAGRLDMHVHVAYGQAKRERSAQGDGGNGTCSHRGSSRRRRQTLLA